MYKRRITTSFHSDIKKGSGKLKQRNKSHTEGMARSWQCTQNLCLCLCLWSLVSGLWSLVSGLWSLVSGLWSLVSGLCLCLCHLFVRAMAATAVRRTAKSTSGGASSPSWPSNPGQTPVGDPRSLAPMLNFEHAQQLQSASLSLLQEQSAQAENQSQPVTSPLDQSIEESVQYQPTGNDQTPLTTETSSQYQHLAQVLLPPRQPSTCYQGRLHPKRHR